MRFTVAVRDVGFTEGPVVTSGGALAFVSVDRGEVHLLDDRGARVLAATQGGPNGLSEGRDGTLYVAQNGGRWSANPRATFTGGVQAIAPDGAVSWLTQDPVAPNDLCIGPDGWLYVTDPTRRPEMDDGRLWRVELPSGHAELLTSVDWYPNGIGFAPDDSLYVARTGERQILRYRTPRAPADPEVFCTTAGPPDGFAWDAAGRLVVGVVGTDGPGSLEVYDPDGTLVETIEPGPSRHYTNVAISAAGTLYVTDAGEGGVVTARWPCAGLPLHPFRNGRP